MEAEQIIELLKPFLANENRRECLRNVIRQDGRLWASDGFILIGVPDNPQVVTDPEMDAMAPNFLTAIKKIDVDHRTGFLPLLVSLPKARQCDQCHGAGKIRYVQCPECDGEGTFENGTHDYECKECDGTGDIDPVPGEVSAERVCDECNGSGERKHQPVVVGHQAFSRRYLAKVLALPGVEVNQDLASNHAGMLFRFDGDGIGALMPVIA